MKDLSMETLLVKVTDICVHDPDLSYIMLISYAFKSNCFNDGFEMSCVLQMLANASADLANVSEKAIQPEINHNDERKASAPNTPNNQVEKIPLSTVSPDVADIAIKEAPLHTESTKSVPEDAKSDVLTEQVHMFSIVMLRAPYGS